MGTTGQSITLANSIIGVGILAMPFCYQQCGVVLATLILLIMGLVSRLCCYFLLKSALLARRRNFEFLGFHVFGPAGKMAVELGIIGFLMGTNIAYFVVVGDLGPQIIAKMFNINQSDILRTSIMVIVSLVCVLPLGLLRNVDSLSNVSAATIGFYFCLVIKVVAEAASKLWAGEWQAQVAMWKPAGLLQCVPIFSMALFCQTQLFEIFESMPSLSLEKMNLVTKNAINICTGVYFTLGLFGYIAFSSQTISGNILMSLSPTMASDVIKLGFVMSVACSFPLIIFPCRASLYSFLYKKVHSTHHDHLIHNSIPESTFRCITVGIIAVALFISLLLPNIELVLGLVGSTIGVLICVVFPAACFVNVTFKNTNERVLAKGIVVLGLVILVLGTYANLQAAENQVDRYDDKYITQERIDKIVEDFFESKKRQKHNFESLPDHMQGNGHGEHKDFDVAPKVVIKDSEVQPPNPEPPETHSKEKVDETNPIAVKKVETSKENKSKDVKAKNVNDSHPRNIKAKLYNESKQINGAPEIINQVEENIQKEDLAQEKKKQEQENLRHAEKLQENIDMMKHQKLIETIKQHGEEQKELLEEQKEILHELEKTKEEIKQNKQEAGNNEAKKIAVESIQKIALKAIESLGGVSDKPAQSEGKKPEPNEVEAVQQIAKHAVESIVAIQDAGKDKSGPNNQVPNPQSIVDVNKKREIPVQNSVSVHNDEINAQNVQSNVPPQLHMAQKIGDFNNNIVKEANIDTMPLNNDQQINNLGQNALNPQPNVPQLPIAKGIGDLNKNIVKEVKIEPFPVYNVQQANNINHIVQNPAQIVPKGNTVVEQNIQKEIKQVEEIKVVEKEHLHAPDEPQSYKEGEDAQKLQNNQETAQNVPLPLALIANSQVGKENPSNQANHNEIGNLNVDNKVNLPKPIDNINNIGVLNNVEIKKTDENQVPDQGNNRQKREVVDCTEKTTLKPEDKRICETLVATTPVKNPQENYQNSPEILSSKVDLIDHVNRLPIDTNVIHRTLKSFDESER